VGNVTPLRGVSASSGAGVARPLSVEGFTFRSQEELVVYRALRAAQRRLPRFRSIAISVNVPVSVAGRDRPFIVDLLVVHNGRCAALEVDGPSHRGRWCDDRTRDRLLEDAGIGWVEHVPVEETSDAAELALTVERFLDRLAR
jgi:hypothetical protein